MIEQHAHKRQSIDWAIIGVYLALVLIGFYDISIRCCNHITLHFLFFLQFHELLFRKLLITQH